MRWSLKELYSSFDSSDYLEDKEKFNILMKDFIEWADNNLSSLEEPKEKMEKYINFNIDIKNIFTRLMAFGNLTSSVEATNEVALREIDQLRVSYSKLTKPNVQFQSFIKNIENLEKIISLSDLLKEHSFFLKEIKKQSQYMLSEKEEILISKMSNTGSSAWSNLQNMISSTLLVDIEIDGKNKKLPLPAVRNLAYNKDPAKRKAGFYAEMEAYKKIEESSAAALNGIKGEVITTTELRGFSSPLEETLVDSRMNKKTLDAMILAIEESLPIFHKYFRKKAEVLGYKNGLPFYEMFAPMGKANMSFTYDEAMTYIVKNFRTFSNKLGDFTENAYKQNWLDIQPREGKRGGAFCSNLHPIKESRILANFNGSFSNMTTLAHELGHAYHGLILQNESILNSRYPMPIAETASIFCETIVVNAALKDASDDEALSILESSISDAGQVIVDIYSRYLFETKLFEKRKNHALSVKELKEIMLEAQKKAYGSGLDHNILHPYMWINKPHYYSAGRNFYNFPYAFGLLFSKGLYVNYVNKGEDFIKDYDNLLNATGKKNIEDVAMKMEINVENPDFFRSSLNLIEKDIDKFLQLVEG